LATTAGRRSSRCSISVSRVIRCRSTRPNPLVGLAWRRNRLYGVEIFPADEKWTTDNANLVAFDPVTGARTEVLNGFASLPNELIVGPDGALYTSNWGISFAADGGDGQVLRIVP